jgi:hypothetical protein
MVVVEWGNFEEMFLTGEGCGGIAGIPQLL